MSPCIFVPYKPTSIHPQPLLYYAIYNQRDKPSVDIATLEAFKSCPKGKDVKTYRSFLALPQTNMYCSRVDEAKGMWYWCGLCNKEVKCRKGRPFTLARWNDHENEPGHLDIIRHKAEAKRIGLKKKSTGVKLSSLEQSTLQQLNKTQVPMMQFFSKKKSTKEVNESSEPSKSTPKEVNESSKSSDTIEDDITSWPPKKKPISCEGVMSDFRGDLKPFF